MEEENGGGTLGNILSLGRRSSEQGDFGWKRFSPEIPDGGNLTARVFGKGCGGQCSGRRVGGEEFCRKHSIGEQWHVVDMLYSRSVFKWTFAVSCCCSHLEGNVAIAQILMPSDKLTRIRKHSQSEFGRDPRRDPPSLTSIPCFFSAYSIIKSLLSIPRFILSIITMVQDTSVKPIPIKTIRIQTC